EAVVGCRGDPGGERVEDTPACDREHARRVEPVLPVDVGAYPRPERLAVAEARVDGVLEVRVRVDESRDDRPVLEMALGACLRHLYDRAVLEADEPALERLPVDGQHPVRGDLGQVATGSALRAARRSSSTAAQIEPSYSTRSGIASSVVVTGSTPGRR